MTLDQGENIVTKQTYFLVMEQPSIYNVIINRPLMKKISIVTIVYNLIVKFSIPTMVGYIKESCDMAMPHLVIATRLSRSQRIQGSSIGRCPSYKTKVEVRCHLR